MSYVSYDNFMRGVLPYCTGAPEVVAYDAVRNAAIQFCNDSHWLLYTPDPVSGIAGVATYQLDCPNDTIVARIDSAWWDTWHIEPKSSDQLRALYGIDWRTIQGTPRYYLQTDDPSEIVVVPYPQLSEPNALTTLVVLRPTRDSATIDRTMYERWYEPLCAGALSRLMSTPAQAYSNMAQAGIRQGQFLAGIGDAKIERNRGLNRANLVLRPPRFF